MTTHMANVPHRDRYIAVVDCEQAFRTKTLRYLTESGHEAAGFDDPGAALEPFRRRAPDIAVIDIGRPSADGIGLFRTLRGDPRTAHILCLFVGRGGHPLELDRGIRLGRNDVLRKPFTRRRLAVAIAPLLKRLDLIEAMGGSGRFRADTRVLDLHDVLGLIRAYRLTGRLTLERPNRDSPVQALFMDGRLIHADRDGDAAGQTLMEVMLWPSVRYAFRPEPRDAMAGKQTISREDWEETMAALELLDRGRLNPFPLGAPARRLPEHSGRDARKGV